MAIRLTAAPQAIMVAKSTMVEAIISFSIVSPAGSLHRSGDRSCDPPPMICDRTPTSGEPRSCPRRGKGGMGVLKIGRTLGVGTSLVQRVVTEQPRPFDVDVAEPYAVQ